MRKGKLNVKSAVYLCHENLSQANGFLQTVPSSWLGPSKCGGQLTAALQQVKMRVKFHIKTTTHAQGVHSKLKMKIMIMFSPYQGLSCFEFIDSSKELLLCYEYDGY
jgi:hypothetical protein